PLSGSIDFNAIPLQISGTFQLTGNVGPAGATPKAGALLPGGTAGLRVDGFAVSAGTTQPELAYELVKYLSSDGQVANAFSSSSPDGRRLVGIEPEFEDQVIFRPQYPEEVQALSTRALENALPTSEMRFSFYIEQIINRVVHEDQDLAAVLPEIEAEATQNLQ